MGFESYRQGTFTKRLADLPDQPNMQAAELKTYFDSSPEELRQALNRLCDALGEFSAAAKLGYTASAGVPAQTVQDAIENVQKQVCDASVGKLPSGCVDGDKLAQDVRNRLTAIEHAAESETNARTAADTDLQTDMNTVKTTLTVKTACNFGTYTGDGTEKRTISLGYRPRPCSCSARAATPVTAAPFTAVWRPRTCRSCTAIASASASPPTAFSCSTAATAPSI